MRILYILLSFTLLIATEAKGQVRGPMPNPPEHKVIKFYPNPAVSYITFELAKDANKTFTLQIFSFLGRMVKNVPDISEKATIQLGDLTRGLYTFQVKDETGRTTDSGIFQVMR